MSNSLASTSISFEQHQRLLESHKELSSQYDELKAKFENVVEQLAWFKRQLFGEKSEKRLVADDPQQADWLLALGISSPCASEEAPQEKVSGYTRSKKNRDNAVNDTGLRFTEDVPIETIVLPCSELEGSEADYYEEVSEKITYRLAQRVGSYVILKYVRKVFKEKATQKITTMPAPEAVFDKSVADVSFLAGMLVDKFLYHLPLYRQHQRLKQSGITLSRMTLTSLTHKSIALLRPIVNAQLIHCLESKVLAMDETPIKAGREKKGKMHKSYFWPIYGEDDEIVFLYSKTRGSAIVKETLSGFTGVLLSDGYEVYERYVKNTEGVTGANCWSHARRYFDKSLRAEPEASQEALEIIGRLYKEEEVIREQKLTGEKKLSHRQTYSVPIIEGFWKWCQGQSNRYDLTPKNPFCKALDYVTKRKEALEVFLSHPDVAIDTNHLERGLRPIPMGRKAWLFCWTEIGAQYVGIIQSLIVTCQLHGVDPYVYLVDVLQRVSQHPADLVHELTPRIWKEKFAENPLRSDLYDTS